MRILHTTDIYHQLRWLDWLRAASAEVDLVCVTGDLLDLFLVDSVSVGSQVRDVTSWVNGFPSPLALCSGNHDWLPEGDALPHDQAEGRWLRALRRPGKVFVDGDDVLFGDHRVVCVPWIGGPELQPGTRRTLVLTHVGPAGTGVASDMIDEMGAPDVRRFALAARARSFVLSGHVHQPLRWFDVVGNCVCLNPGMSDRAAAHPAHTIIDTGSREVRYVRPDAPDLVLRWKVDP